MSTPSSTSTIAPARAALFDLLVADAPAATSQVPTQPTKPIQVSFGPPGHEQLEVVTILDVRTSDEDDESLGAYRREETYEIGVGVKVHNPAAGAGSPAALLVDARGFALCDWVRSVVHRHWTLKQTVRRAAVTDQAGGTYTGAQLADRGCLFYGLLVVTCEASLVTTDAAP